MLCVYALVRDTHASVSPLPDASAARTSPCIALKGGTPVLASEPANRPGRAGMLFCYVPCIHIGTGTFIDMCTRVPLSGVAHLGTLGWRTREWRRRYPAPAHKLVLLLS